MNKKRRTMVCAVAVMLLLSIIVGVAVALIPQREQDIPETNESTTKTAPQQSSQTDLGETSAVQTQDQTEADDYEDNREERETAEPIPKIAFDEGNEIYMDMDVVSKLEAMEKAEGDARVNKILDAIIMLINKFEDKGYSSKAIKQIQRFYFICHDELMQKDHDTVENKIGQLIPASGAYSDSFAERAYDLLGIDRTTDYSYIFEVHE